MKYTVSEIKDLEVANSDIEEKQEAEPAKPLTRKEKRRQKIYNKYSVEEDFKYLGPLSYRYIRILAWIALAIAQLVVVNRISTIVIQQNFLVQPWESIVGSISNVATPLFIVAAFGRLFNRKKTYRYTLLLYLGAYLGMALGIIIAYHHFVGDVLRAISGGEEISDMLAIAINDKIQINIFSDLLIVSLINFFINYHPKKFFQGRKIALFRFLVIIPILFSASAYVLKCLAMNYIIDLPLEVYPFLTSKSFIIHFIFLLVSLWFKKRENKAVKSGRSIDEFSSYLDSNKNSFAFSMYLMRLFIIFTVIDFLLLIAVGATLYLQGYDDAISIEMANKYGLGECLGLFLVAPILLLYSYKREHKDTTLDIIIPLAGIGLIAFVYLEGILRILIQFISE